MRLFNSWKLVLAMGLAAIGVPASGHHSFAMFDQSKEITLKAMIVTRFEWTNPHVFVIGEKDSVTYTLECSSPNLMTHQGWKHNTITAGAKIDIVYYPLRNGKPGGMLKTVVLPNGQKISAW
ncbi:MAG: DUF6152 family protein [Novosphingobium sp.]